MGAEGRGGRDKESGGEERERKIDRDIQIKLNTDKRVGKKTMNKHTSEHTHTQGA